MVKRMKPNKFKTIYLCWLLIFLLFPLHACSTLFQDKGIRQDKQTTITYRQILKHYSLVSPELSDNVLYFFRNLPTKRHNVGELCRYDVKKNRYTAISKEISGFVGIDEIVHDRLVCQFRGGSIIPFYKETLKSESSITNSSYYARLLTYDDHGSFWAEGKSFLNYFTGLVYVDNQFHVVWRFSVERSEQKRSRFLYPRIVVQQELVQVFSYDTGKILHHALQLHSGKVEIQEVLLTKADYFASPFERTPFEDILIERDTCYLFSTLGNQLNILIFSLQNPSYIKTDQIDYTIDPVLDFSQIRNSCIKQINDQIIIPVELTWKTERVGIERGRDWKKSVILYFDTKHKIIFSQEIPKGSLEQIWLSKDHSRFFLIYGYDGDFTSIPWGITFSYQADSIVCIDMATRSIQWEKELEQLSKVHYHEAYFWTYTNEENKPILRMNEQGEITNTIELSEAKAAYYQQREKDKKIPFRTGISWFIYVFPIHQNKAIITTSNGYVYSWTKKEGE